MAMVKYEDLKDGDILELEADIKNEWSADRREKYDWQKRAALAKGMRFVVREDWSEHQGRRFTWFSLEQVGGRYAGNYRLAVHGKPPRDPDDWRYFLGRAILANAARPALTFSDQWARLNFSEYHFQNVIEVLIAHGELSLAQVEAAAKQHICCKCDSLADPNVDARDDYYCATHAPKTVKGKV